MQPKVCVVLLNWNGYQDTLACLESILKSDYSNFFVIVCDNDSQDNSWNYFKAWCAGEYLLDEKVVSPLHHSKIFPVYPKPVSAHFTTQDRIDESPPVYSKVIFIQNGDNLGFAAGVNVGLQYAIDHYGDCAYMWILNNDTVVESNCISEQVEVMQKDSRVGICGSTLRFYHQPDKIQALGFGVFYNFLGTSNDVRYDFGRLSLLTQFFSVRFTSGASMFVSRDYLKKIGLMCEDYFLFFEEPDWAFRMRNVFKAAHAKNSVVYHKVGGARAHNGVEVGVTSDFYRIRNRILFVRRYAREAVILVYIGLFYEILKRLVRGEYRKVRNALKIVGYSFFHWDLSRLRP